MNQSKTGFPSINLSEYLYDLPKDLIAQYPQEIRDQSKLLNYKGGEISHHKFADLVDLIPLGSTLFFNDTRVIPARIMFQRKTRAWGAWIEVFLLEPIAPSKEIAEAMLARNTCIWKCMIGNLKKWKDDEVLEHQIQINNSEIIVRAKITSREKMNVELEWNHSKLTFSEVLDALGKIPLPPYMTREVEELDEDRYQTVYSKNQGAVAAPTAGLHFTEDLLSRLSRKMIQRDFLTLHVSSGTFQPIKTDDVADHRMHSEQMVITRNNIENLLKSTFSIAVGTTSMRTMESLYWYGVKLETDPFCTFHIEKNTPYKLANSGISMNKALTNVLRRMSDLKTNSISGVTEIFIVPGYEFMTCNALITNFHIPGSTLMLLVAAFIGKDWMNVYKAAKAEKYRFLSYGDSSILFGKKSDSK